MSSLDEIIFIAKEAEDYGFNYVLVSDLPKNRGLWPLLGGLALNTKRVKLGPGITNPYITHPIVIAQNLSTLAEVAKGRVVCGLGAGDEEALKTLGINRYKPIEYVKEATELIRAYLKGEGNYKGEIFRLIHFKSNFSSTSNIPIYIGAQGKKMLELAKSIGDGVLINSSNPKYLKKFKLREKENFKVGVISPYFIADSHLEAKRILSPLVATIVAGCSSNTLEEHGLSLEDKERVLKALKMGDLDLIRQSVKDYMLESFSIFGRAEECLEKISELKELGVNLFIACLPSSIKSLHKILKDTKEKILVNLIKEKE